MSDFAFYRRGPWTVAAALLFMGGLYLGSRFGNPTLFVVGGFLLGFLGLTYYYYRRARTVD